jgi:adenine-specific DNA-methyltransferase
MGKIVTSYPYIHTIRYMGNKGKLLDFVVPAIESLSEPGDCICDLMCGTASVGYALSSRNRIIANDFEFYSSVIANAFLKSTRIPTVEEGHNDLDKSYFKNIEAKKWRYFYDTYSDTYFSRKQCLEIDSLRYAIGESNEIFFNLYLTCLMSAMCKAQSTSGHFAQFLRMDSPRVQPLRKLSIYDLFFEKLGDFKNYIFPKYVNEVFNLDYKVLFSTQDLGSVSCFYLDSPYTFDQYSRFYHILETVCLYDKPQTFFKGKYRSNRKMSDFCYKDKVLDEFEKIISFAKINGSSLVISYSDHGVTSVDSIVCLAKKYYNKCNVSWRLYNHSSQGQGDIGIKECVILLHD